MLYSTYIYKCKNTHFFSNPNNYPEENQALSTF